MAIQQQDLMISSSGKPRKALNKTIVLPLIISKENKAVMGVILTTLATFLYLTSNHFHIAPPQLLPMSMIDNAVPFIPETIWIYLSEYFLFFTTYAAMKDIRLSNRYVYSFLSLQTVSVLIFWVFPTAFPRDLFPLPEGLDAATAYVFKSLRTTDSPANCLPSLHVSSVYLSALMFLKERRSKFPYMFLWATMIGVSTLTTKQHYLIDVITGLLMAVTFHWIFDTLVTYRGSEAVAGTANGNGNGNGAGAAVPTGLTPGQGTPAGDQANR